MIKTNLLSSHFLRFDQTKEYFEEDELDGYGWGFNMRETSERDVRVLF